MAVAAVSAQAATMKAVYTGTLVDYVVGSDVRRSAVVNMFGFTGLNYIAGEAFRAEFVYDTGRGKRGRTPDIDSLTSYVSPLVRDPFLQSVTMTVNGVSIAFPFGAANENVSAYRSGKELRYAMNTIADGSPFGLIGVSATFVSDGPVDLEHPVTLSDPISDAGYFLFLGSGSESASLRLSIEKLTISEVPLPATLPLAVAGLAGLGFLARRRAG